MSTPKKNGAAPAMTLGALAAAAKQQAQEELSRRADVDVSDLFGLPKGAMVFTLRKLSVAEDYRAGDDATNFRRQRPEFNKMLAYHVALLSKAHVSPMPDEGEPTVGEAYLSFADNDALMGRLLAGYFSAFGPASLPSVEEEKNDSGVTSDDTTDSPSA